MRNQTETQKPRLGLLTMTFKNAIRVDSRFKQVVAAILLYSVLLPSFAIGAPAARGASAFPEFVGFFASFQKSASSFFAGIAEHIGIGSGVHGLDPAPFANPVTAFTAKRFTRTTGAPNNYVETFTMPAECASGDYRLYLKNGEQTGANRVSSAEIKLNGTLLFTESEFNEQVHALEKDVTLAAENTLQIRLASSPGAYVTIEVRGENCGPADTVPPSLVIASPADNFATQSSTAAISGTAEDTGGSASGIAQVTVNGAPAAYDAGTKIWQFAAVALASGTNAIVVRTVDNAGNEATSQVSIIRDNTAPAITITSPATTPFTTLSSTIAISGTAIDSSADGSGVATVKINGMTVNFDPATGGWTVPEHTLNVGPNTILVKATDRAGNESTAQIAVNRVVNAAPVVSAGADRVIELSAGTTLAASVSDDGYPTGNLSILWNKISGPGDVTFTAPSAAETGVSFGSDGTYQLRVTASDGALSTSDEIAVTVHSPNQAPVVNAGPDRAIELPNSATLEGIATDDGYPLGSTLAISWLKIDGPGNVSFSNPTSASTSASFSEPGSYTLRLTATDGALSTSDDLVVTVSPQNQAPTVDAGATQTIELPASASLSGSATDDGLPSGSSLIYAWLKISGESDVLFGSPNAANTQATFTQAGTYTLRLTVSDGQLLTSDEVTITILPQNGAPVVNVGNDQTVVLPNPAALNGSATDDGYPAGSSLSYSWSKILGEGNVTFGNASSASTTAAFSQPGIYTLRLTSSDGRLSASDDLVVTVHPANQAPTVSAGDDAVVTLPNAAHLTGSASDDGYPSASTLAIIWSKLSGPGDVAFGNASQASTSAAFSAAGVYVLRLTTTDGELSTSDDVAITVVEQNQPPVVNAGSDQSIQLPAIATLAGTATDDGRPTGGTLASSWSKVSGPGDVAFAGAASLSTTATFSAAGIYELKLEATDGELSSSDTLVLTVSPQGGQPQAGYTIPNDGGPLEMSIDSFSSLSSAIYHPSSLLDDSRFTDWRTAANQVTNQFVKFRIASGEQLVERFRLQQGNSSAGTMVKDFLIQVSDKTENDADFSTVVTGSLLANDTMQEFALPAPIFAKFVRFVIVSRHGTSSQVILGTLQAVGTGGANNVVSLPGTTNLAKLDSPSLLRNGAMVTRVSSFEAAPVGIIGGGNTWRTKTKTNEFIVIKLAGDEGHTLRGIRIWPFFADYQNYWVRDFEIWVSDTVDEDPAFTQVFSGTKTAFGNEDFNFPGGPVRAKYIKYVPRTSAATTFIGTPTIEALALDARGVDSFSPGFAGSTFEDAFVTNSSVISSPPNNWLKLRVAKDTETVIGMRVEADNTSIYGNNGPRDYEVRVSTTTNDEAAFTTVHTGTLAAVSSIQNVRFAQPVEARFVKVHWLTAYNGSSIIVRKLEITALAADGGTLTSVSTPGETHTPPARMLDLDQEQRNPGWISVSGQTTNQQATVRLYNGELFDIDHVSVRPGMPLVFGTFRADASPRDFEIQVSSTDDADASFSTVYSGTMANVNRMQHFYFPSVPARYVRLLIKNNYGYSVVAINTILVYGKNTGPQDARFFDRSIDPDGDIVSYEWDFGDGETSTEREPAHVYDVPGLYNVRLTVTDSTGLSSTIVRPYRALPTLEADFSYQPESPVETDQGPYAVYFANLSSPRLTSTFGTVYLNVKNYPYQFQERNYTSQTFQDNGSWPATVEFGSEYTLRHSVTKNIPVQNLAPIVDIDVGKTVYWGEPWTNTVKTLTDPGPADRSTLRGQWTYGDGGTASCTNCSIATAKGAYTYALPGTYTATLAITDKDGGTSSDSADYVVLKHPTRVAYTNIGRDGSQLTIAGTLSDTWANVVLSGKPLMISVNGFGFGAVTDASGAFQVTTPIDPAAPLGDVFVDFAEDAMFQASSNVYSTVPDRTPLPANSPQNGGTDFLLAFPINAHYRPPDGFNANPPRSYLLITSDVNTTGSVVAPGCALNQTFNVTARSVTTINVPFACQVRNADLVSSQAVRVTTQQPVVVYGLNENSFTTDAFLGLPVSSLGTEYIGLTYGNGYQFIAGSQLVVAATENATTVTIKPSVTVGTRMQGIPYQITLNQGQTYSLISQEFGAEKDLTGSVVSADKRIAVFGGQEATAVPGTVTCCADHLVEQMAPVNTWGKRFVIIPTATRTKGDVFRVVGSQDGTGVYLNGIKVATLNRGQIYEQLIKDASEIISTAPVMVGQYATAAAFDSATHGADPFMSIVPPYLQYLNHYTISTLSRLTNFVNIAVPTAAIGQVTLDGTAIAASSFTPIGTSGFSGARLNLAVGAHHLDAPVPFGVFSYGYGNTEGYGYPGGMGLVPTVSTTNLSLTPETSAYGIGSQACVSARLYDQDNIPLGGRQIAFSVTGANPSTAQGTTGATGAYDYCYTGTNIGTDTVTATFGSTSSTATVIFSPPNQPPTVDAGADQSITLPGSAALVGTAADDGYPTNTLVASWVKISGPGDVTFANATSLATGATFALPGVYEISLSVSDGQYATVDQLLVTVSPEPQNQAPTASAGTDASARISANLVRNPSSEDELVNDEVPQWTEVLGGWTRAEAGVNDAPPARFGNHTFMASNDAAAELRQDIDVRGYVAGIAAGTQEFTLQAHVRSLAENTPDTGQIIFEYRDAANQNVIAALSSGPIGSTNAWHLTEDARVPPPGTGFVRIRLIATRNSGETNDVFFDGVSLKPNGNVAAVKLEGTANDDGLPNGSSLTTTWTKISGGGDAIFSDAGSVGSSVTFDAPGTYVLRLTATDGALSTTDEVSVTVAAANAAPVVNAGPDQTVNLPANGSVAGTATDDSGVAPRVRWEKVSGPGVVSFANPGALATSITFGASGSYVLRLTAEDGELESSDEVAFAVNAAPVNQPPTFDAGANQTIQLPINSVTLSGTASDDGLPGGSLSTVWTKRIGPGGAAFANPNVPQTSVSFDAAGTYVLRFTVSDGEYTGFDEVVVTVNPANGSGGGGGGGEPNQPPVINAGADQTIPVLQTAIFEAVSIVDDGLPAGANYTSQWSKVSGEGEVTFTHPTQTATYATFNQTGTYVVRLSVSDSDLIGFDDITLTVIDSQPGPAVDILTPGDGTGISAPTMITGTVSGGVWRLEHSLADSNNAAARTWTRFASGSGAASSDLGSLDTTLMLNGLYDVRLTTTDQYGQISTETISVVVENNLKVGHFTVSFDDMNVPVNGVPMQIVRTYDSRDKRPGDFGIGWTLSIRNIRVEKNRTIGLNWRQTSNGALFPTYCVEATRPHIVTVTMPDGMVEKFNAKLRRMCQQYAPVDYGYVDFEPEPGTRGKLEVVGDNYVAVVGSVPGPMEFVGFNGQGIFDSASFRYTAKDGTQFTLRQGVGLEQVRDLDGNTLTINAGGIHHSSGVSIAFTRDSFGRITNVTDPKGEDNVYGYDAAGDLVSFTDREDNETTFTYEPAIPHHLKSIVDPLGRTPIRNDYDASGRLIKHTDAEGNEIVYTHDLAARVETIRDRLGNPTVYEYDGRGNVLKKRDALNHETTYSYDANDNMLTETNALGKTTVYTYDAFDNRTSVTDPLGNKTEVTYNQLGQELNEKDARGRTTISTYSPSGQLLTTTDPIGSVTTNIYDLQTGQLRRVRDAYQHETQYEYTNSRLTTEIDPQGNITTYGYDANGNESAQTVRRTNALGQVETITTTLQYDKLNRIIKTTHADGSFTRVEYNELGQQEATIDRAGHRTEFEHDALGRLIKTTHPDGKFEESTYDDEGRRLTSKDRAGRVTTFEYDEIGRLKKTIYADGTFTLTSYDAAGRVVTSTDARANVTTFTYDDAGRRLTVKNALDQVTSFAYDRNGNQTSMTDARNNTFGYVYDDANRRTRVNFADASFTETTYDKLGRRIADKDHAGKVTQFVYDSLGRMTKVIDALDQETRYEHNELGQQTKQIDALNRETKYEYDKLGRRTKRILPLGQIETNAYNAAGNLESRTDFNGKTTTYHYDNMRRLLSKTPDASLGQPTISFTYNDLGQRATMTDASGVTAYGYDVRNRLAAKQTPFGTLSYTYDDAGSIETLRSSNVDGVSVDYAHDELNRLQTVKDNRLAGNQTTGYTYDAAGNLESYTYPNAVTTSYGYNNLNRLTAMTVANASGNLASYAYTLGPAGNRTQVVEGNGRTVNYVYDDLYRLTRETIANSANNGVVDYQHDPVGNRLTRISSVSQVPNQSSTFDANDRLNSDTYDANGNTRISNGRTFNYDFENKLTSTSDGITIVYDGDGNRVSKTVGGETTNYLVDTNNLTGYAQIVEEIQNSQVVKAYTYGHDLISQRQGSAVSFYSYDGHGSVRQLTSAGAAVTDTFAYDAFGSLIERTGTTDNNYLYAGEQFDPDLGFYYNRARYLNVATGRFVSQDSYEGVIFDPASLHKYLYAHANPVSNTDPSGNSIIAEVQALVVRAGLFTSSVGIGVLRAFQNGTIGNFWRALGAKAEEFAQATIALRSGVQIVDRGVAVGARNIDFLLRSGERFAYLEVKYSLPARLGPAMDRLVGQINAMVSAGNGQAVVWTLKEPTLAQMRQVLAQTGPAQVQFVHGIEGLYNWMRLYFGA